jgi:2',3'-cyclic-nucleotide 2'-phosphodiesterase (5'-nucleotidase family)
MINRILPRLFCICLCSFLLISCVSPTELKETEIVIISFNDVHGNFKNLPKISAFIKETKENHEHVIVVDVGDRFTGNPYNDYHERRQFPIIDLMNTLGLDVAVVGNHEFDYGIDLLRDRMRETHFHEIVSNVELTSTALHKLIAPHHIVKIDDIEVVFFGLICVDRHTGKTVSLLDYVADITFRDPFETAKKCVESLRKKSHLLIALSHLGTSEDYRLADSIPELDMIIGGHSHYLTAEPEFHNGVKILNADKYGDFIFKTTIIMKGYDILDMSSELFDVSLLVNEDPMLVEKVKAYENNPFLKQPILTLKHPFNRDQLGLMIADAALTIPSVDFSIVNYGSVRTDTLMQGPIAYADILRVMPFNNHYGIVQITPAKMREILGWGFDDPNRRGDAYPGGFHYVLDRSEDIRKFVKLTYPNGKELDENKAYRVVINNSLVSRHFFNSRNEAEMLSIFVIDNMVQFLIQNPNVDYRKAPRRVQYIYNETTQKTDL